jgi:predicted dinucleotide-binding enzyme
VNYAIIGFGKIGQAIAKAFARRNIEVFVASRRSPETHATIAKSIGPTVITKSLQDALKAEVIFLTVPFGQTKDVSQAALSWAGKIIVDVTNAFGVPPGDLGNRPSSVSVSRDFEGAKLVKGFNHLAAETLAQNPRVKGGRRVVFISSNDEIAAARVMTVAEQLGFAPVNLGRLAEGGLLVQARGNTWAHLIFQDFIKL